MIEKSGSRLQEWFFTYNHWLGSNVCLSWHRGTMVAGGLRDGDDRESFYGPRVDDGPQEVVVVLESAVDQLVADGQEPPLEEWRW